MDYYPQDIAVEMWCGELWKHSVSLLSKLLL